MDYKNLEEVVVTTQNELDDISLDFKGRIYIKSSVRIVVTNKYYFSVEAMGISSVIARDNSSVVARDNSSVEAWDNSSVEAMGISSVVAWGNSQIVDRLSNGKIQINGNARIVYMPKNINDFMDFYGIKHTKTKAIFYKAVHKKDDVYVSNYDYKFIYRVGETVSLAEINTDVECDCGAGLHISHLHWALDFGSSWNDLAILECETKISDVIMPKNTNGKVRTSKLKVIREIPLEECGVYGKILAKRSKK